LVLCIYYQQLLLSFNALHHRNLKKFDNFEALMASQFRHVHGPQLLTTQSQLMMCKLWREKDCVTDFNILETTSQPQLHRSYHS